MPTDAHEVGLSRYNDGAIDPPFSDLNSPQPIAVLDATLEPGSPDLAEVEVPALPEVDGGRTATRIWVKRLGIPATTAVIALFSLFATTAFASEPTAPGTFTDVPGTHPNYTAVEYLHELGVLNGYADHTFRPDNEITRAEIIKLMVWMKKGVFNPEEISSYDDCFDDVRHAGEWYERYVCYAKDQKWVQGYADHTFKPNSGATRLEAIKMMLNAFFGGEENILKLTSKEQSTLMPSDSYDSATWYYGFLQYALAKSLLDERHETFVGAGVYKYYGNNAITRKEMAEMLFRLMTSTDYEIENFAAKTFPSEYKVRQIILKDAVDGDVILQTYARLELDHGDTYGPYYAWIKKKDGLGPDWDVVYSPTNNVDDTVINELRAAGVPEALYMFPTDVQ